MSQEQNNSQDKKASMKKAINSDIIASVVSIAIIFIFGVAGGLICYGGYWVVMLIVKSNKPAAAKVVLSVLAVLVCLALLYGVIVLSAAVSMGEQG